MKILLKQLDYSLSISITSQKSRAHNLIAKQKHDFQLISARLFLGLFSKILQHSFFHSQKLRGENSVLQEGSKEPVTSPTSIGSLTSKTIHVYSLLLSPEDISPTTSEKKTFSGWRREKKIYFLPFKATNEIKLIMFQCKFIDCILRTNILLHKIKKKLSRPLVPFVLSECQITWYLFINCTQATSFWIRFQE